MPQDVLHITVQQMYRCLMTLVSAVQFFLEISHEDIARNFLNASQVLLSLSYSDHYSYRNSGIRAEAIDIH